MIVDDLVTQWPTILRPNPARTVIRPFVPEDLPAFAEERPRAQRIADRILAQDDAAIADELTRVTESLAERHRDVEALLERRFEAVNGLLIDRSTVSRDRAMLLGAYFSAEYSFEAAALFNPSIVRHPDQTKLPDGAIRFVLALRGVGEGHLSSVTFREGVWTPGSGGAVDASSQWAVSPRFTLPAEGAADQTVRLTCGGSEDLSETVIFPVMPSQRGGIEDLRLVQFTEEDGTTRYVGTYTAFSGTAVREEMLCTSDFSSFEMRPLTGAAAGSKGMALFPRRIDGRYAMLGRQDNESIWLMHSDDMLRWEGGSRIITPKWPWDSVQMGNCGSPIELAEGWLAITHGVGAVRGYSIGACLLDKQDPTKILARMATPLLRPTAEQRDGYVPNVVYSCGAMVHDRTLLLPYGVADSFTTFATVSIDELLGAMD